MTAPARGGQPGFCKTRPRASDSESESLAGRPPRAAAAAAGQPTGLSLALPQCRGRWSPDGKSTGTITVTVLAGPGYRDL